MQERRPLHQAVSMQGTKEDGFGDWHDGGMLYVRAAGSSGKVYKGHTGKEGKKTKREGGTGAARDGGKGGCEMKNCKGAR